MSDSCAPHSDDVPDFAAPACRSAEFDWSRRNASLTERLDGPLSYAEWLRASRDIARIHAWTAAYRPAISFLNRVVARRGVGYEPLVVLDVGCGHGDTLRHIARWAAQRSVPVHLIGVDLHPYAARAARQCARELRLPAGLIEWRTADVFTAELEVKPDVILSSLFTHHLSDPEVVRFLAWSETQARWGWLINDLRRSPRAYRVFDLAARWLRVHPLVRHDGLISLRRAFTPQDWQLLLGTAGIHAANTVERGTRLCVERLKDTPTR